MKLEIGTSTLTKIISKYIEEITKGNFTPESSELEAKLIKSENLPAVIAKYVANDILDEYFEITPSEIKKRNSIIYAKEKQNNG